MKILVTGGTGYIGSHTAVELLKAGYDITIVDNLSNSSIDVIDKIKEITHKNFNFYKLDVKNERALNKVFKEEGIDAVIHFAAFKAVGESVEKPLKYYENNLENTISLLKVMKKNDIKKIIFSSSACVYGDPESLPIKETARLTTTNPYGATKHMIERILKDVYKAENDLSVIILRYFNPVGADASYKIGENPKGIPNNLMPFIVRVANGEIDHLNIFGNDYDTPDGTGVRDYIHVTDLAIGHIKALEKANKDKGIFVYNLGTGTGYSVLEMVKTFEKVNNVKVPYVITKRRDGDIAACYADPSLAKKELGWVATKGLEEMCYDSYQYIINKK